MTINAAPDERPSCPPGRGALSWGVVTLTLLMHGGVLLSMLAPAPSPPLPVEREIHSDRESVPVYLLGTSSRHIESVFPTSAQRAPQVGATSSLSKAQPRVSQTTPELPPLLNPTGSDEADPKVPLDRSAYYAPETLGSHGYPISDVAFDDGCLSSGTIVLKIWLNETGGVDDVETVTSTAAPSCTDQAKTAFRQTRFVPGKVFETAVKSIWIVEIRNARASGTAAA